MAKISTIIYKGKSGKSYEFNVYPITEECKDESGVYVFSKRLKNDKGIFEHTVIYVGKAKSFESRFYNHHKDDCIDKNGANCICLINIKNEKDRDAAELDLLAKYNTPCNEINN